MSLILIKVAQINHSNSSYYADIINSVLRFNTFWVSWLWTRRRFNTPLGGSGGHEWVGGFDKLDEWEMSQTFWSVWNRREIWACDWCSEERAPHLSHPTRPFTFCVYGVCSVLLLPQASSLAYDRTALVVWRSTLLSLLESWWRGLYDNDNYIETSITTRRNTSVMLLPVLYVRSEDDAAMLPVHGST